jgi:hypothetical protein
MSRIVPSQLSISLRRDLPSCYHAGAAQGQSGGAAARDGARKPVLLLAHLDVVEVRREDWSVEPFKLTEKEGYFYGRCTANDKFMAAAFVANLIPTNRTATNRIETSSWRWRRTRRFLTATTHSTANLDGWPKPI